MKKQPQQFKTKAVSMTSLQRQLDAFALGKVEGFDNVRLVPFGDYVRLYYEVDGAEPVPITDWLEQDELDRMLCAIGLLSVTHRRHLATLKEAGKPFPKPKRQKGKLPPTARRENDRLKQRAIDDRATAIGEKPGKFMTWRDIEAAEHLLRVNGGEV